MLIEEEKHNNVKFIKKYFIIFVTIAIIMNVLYFYRVVKLVPDRTIIDVLEKIVTNPRDLYNSAVNSNLSSNQMFGGKLFAFFVPLFGPITTSIIPISLVYFRYFKKKEKVLSIIAIITQMLVSFSVGTTEGYFNIAIYIAIGLFIRFFHQKRKGFSIKFMLFGLVFGVTVFLLFSRMMINRNLGSFSLSIGNNPIQISDSYLILPQWILTSLVYLNIYLVQGYYGMSLSLGESWTPTFGFGYSTYVIENVSEFFDIQIINNTFMAKIEQYGWGSYVNWHTAYSWLANDFHWFGVIIVLFFLSYLFGSTYNMAVRNLDPTAIMLFGLLAFFFLFIPANNKLFSSPQTFTSFWFFLIIWLIKRRR